MRRRNSTKRSASRNMVAGRVPHRAHKADPTGISAVVLDRDKGAHIARPSTVEDQLSRQELFSG